MGEVFTVPENPHKPTATGSDDKHAWVFCACGEVFYGMRNQAAYHQDMIRLASDGIQGHIRTRGTFVASDLAGDSS